MYLQGQFCKYHRKASLLKLCLSARLLEEFRKKTVRKLRREKMYSDQLLVGIISYSYYITASRNVKPKFSKEFLFK